MLGKTIKWILIAAIAILLVLAAIYIGVYISSEGLYAYNVIPCPSLRWVFPVHEYDTETGKEWNYLKIYDLSAKNKEALLAFAVENSWNALPFTEEQMNDPLLGDYPDEQLAAMKETQNGFWFSTQYHGRCLCVLDTDNAKLYIRGASIY